MPPSNEDIPFEDIQLGQYNEGTRMNRLRTNFDRLPAWIKALTNRYWNTIGKLLDYLVRWEDKRKQNIQEIQISIEKGKQRSKSTNNKLFVITVYLKIGTITIQGNDFQNFGSQEFPHLKSFVDRCMDKQTPCTYEAEAKLPASKESIDELQSEETLLNL